MNAMARRINVPNEASLEVKHDAFSYQLEAFNAIRELEYAAVFHEQGLGKTKIAADLITYWLGHCQIDTVLVVAKKHLIANWRNEIEFHTFLKPSVIGGNRAANFYVFNGASRLMLTHYEAIKSEKERFELFLKTRSVAVVLDESTKIKNPTAALTQVFLELRSGFVRRVIMTGTPVANRPHDIWSQIAFLDGGVALGEDFEAFKRDIDLSNKLAESRSRQVALREGLERIQSRLSNFAVRETKDSGVITLPNKEYLSIETDWESRQLDLYRELRDSLQTIVTRDGALTLDDSEPMLKRLLRLVQVASNPKMVDQNYSAEPGKVPELMDILDSIHRRGEKAIIWTSFVSNVDWLATVLKKYSPVRVHGGMNVEARNLSIEKFLKVDACEILIATPGAAKEGLTLTVANHAIYYDRSFSLDDYLQSQDRIHRISQTKTCYIYILNMKESIDLWIDALLSAKQLAALRAQGDISSDEFEAEISYDFGALLRRALGMESKSQE